MTTHGTRVPIVNRELDDQVGYVLDIDAFGHPGFGIDVNGVWHHVDSTVQLPLKKWSRVTATFDPKQGVTLYVNGSEAGSLKTSGPFFRPTRQVLLSGESARPRFRSLPGSFTRTMQSITRSRATSMKSRFSPAPAPLRTKLQPSRPRMSLREM